MGTNSRQAISAKNQILLLRDSVLSSNLSIGSVLDIFTFNYWKSEN